MVTRGDHHQADGGFQRVRVAADLTVKNAVVLERALALAAPDAQIELVSAWSDPLQALAFDPAVSIGSGAAWSEVEAAIKEELQGLVARSPNLAHHTPNVTVRALFGHPAQAIIERAQEFEANLVVVGSHSHRGVAQFLLGSTAESVLRQASCAVLVAR